MKALLLVMTACLLSACAAQKRELVRQAIPYGMVKDANGSICLEKENEELQVESTTPTMPAQAAPVENDPFAEPLHKALQSIQVPARNSPAVLSPAWAGDYERRWEEHVQKKRFQEVESRLGELESAR